jgi:hypothetical protein
LVSSLIFHVIHKHQAKSRDSICGIFSCFLSFIKKSTLGSNFCIDFCWFSLCCRRRKEGVLKPPPPAPGFMWQNIRDNNFQLPFPNAT